MDCLAEEMAFSQENQDWIKGEINSAVRHAIAPQGWRMARDRILAFGAPAAIVGICIALLAIAFAAVYQSFAHIKEDTQFRTSTGDRMDRIEGQMGSLRLLISASQPLKKQNQDATKQLLYDVRNKLAPKLPEAEVAQAGSNYIDAGITDPNAWNVALDLVSYRTSLNVNLHTVTIAQDLATTKFSPDLLSKYYSFRVPDGYQMPYITLGGDVPVDQAAIMKDVDLPQPPTPSRAKEVALIVGGGIRLDHMIMRHVVIRDSQVLYDGDFTELSDVIFVDCSFVLKNVAAARLFAMAVLGTAPTNFKPTHF